MILLLTMAHHWTDIETRKSQVSEIQNWWWVVEEGASPQNSDCCEKWSLKRFCCISRGLVCPFMSGACQGEKHTCVKQFCFESIYFQTVLTWASHITRCWANFGRHQPIIQSSAPELYWRRVDDRKICERIKWINWFAQRRAFLCFPEVKIECRRSGMGENLLRQKPLWWVENS